MNLGVPSDGAEAARKVLAETARACGRRVVGAGAPAAVGAGLAIFCQGGNAFDAAVAACLVEAVALPMKCGLGGDLVALARTNGGPIRALVSVGPGVAALEQGAQLSRVGPRSVGVPGAPDGYAALAGLGRLGLEAVVEPAVRAAEDGVEWSRLAVQFTQEAESLLRTHNGDTPFLPEGRVPRVGERLRLPGLAALLRKFGQLGGELFFGAEGEVLARRLDAAGGLLRADDLRVRPAMWSAPERLPLPDDASLWATPVPTHGPSLLRAVEMAYLEQVDPIAAVRRARTETGQDRRAPAAAGTSVVTAADDGSNAVVVVHSNSFGQYGSGVVIEDWDLVLNNRPGRGFDLDAPAKTPNAPAAGRVPMTTLHAWALEKRDVTLLGATPGGDNQMPWNLQAVLACVAGDDDLGRVVVEPRWAMDGGGQVVCEADHPFADRGGIDVAPPLSLRSAEQILRLAADERDVQAVADPRSGARVGAVPAPMREAADPLDHTER